MLYRKLFFFVFKYFRGVCRGMCEKEREGERRTEKLTQTKCISCVLREKKINTDLDNEIGG